MKAERYVVDERIGCIAIVDTFYPNESNGLDSYAVNVVKYFNLPRPEENMLQRIAVIDSLREECDKLNKENLITRKDCDAAFSRFYASCEELRGLFPKIYQIRIS